MLCSFLAVQESSTLAVHYLIRLPPFPSLPPSLRPQDDVLYSFLTVHETLTLATHFYLPDSLSDGAKAAYVRDVINALGLAKAANTIIGG